MNKKRIGFLSYWGTPRGLSNVTLNYAKMLKDSDYEVFILKQGENEITEDFKTVDVNISTIPNYVVDPGVFKAWIKTHKLDVVIFNEFDQWNDSGTNLVNIAKECDCKVYGYLVLEKFNEKQTYPYDKILVPTVSGKRFMRNNQIRKFAHIPYSIDLTEFPMPEEKKENEKFTFFHPAGMGGVMDRKNTDVVIKAFNLLLEERDDVKLVITSQKKLEGEFPKEVEVIDKNLDRKDLIQKYYEADCSLLPSKWETIGIPILESLASGTPVITTDVPPMNEFIRPALNGYVCRPELKKYDGISIYAAEIEPENLKNQMASMCERGLHKLLCKNSRYIAEKLYDLEKNKQIFIDFLDKELK